MKKLLLFLSLLFIMSLSVFAGETFKCRKETFFYVIEGREGRTSSNEFLFINNFMIFPHDNYYRKYIFFIRDDKTGDYEAFGEYYPYYLGNGVFSGAAYGVGDPPRVKDKKIEEISYSKTDFYLILAEEFYKWYLLKEAFSSDFDCLNDFLNIVKDFSKEDLRILRNTIYAKYGYTFKSKDLIEIFAQTDWYSPVENFKEDFNPLDLCLLEVIKLAEK